MREHELLNILHTLNSAIEVLAMAMILSNKEEMGTEMYEKVSGLVSALRDQSEELRKAKEWINDRTYP